MSSSAALTESGYPRVYYRSSLRSGALEGIKSTRLRVAIAVRANTPQSQTSMQPAKEPTEAERNGDSGIRLMLNRIDDRALKRHGRLQCRSRGIAVFGWFVICWAQVI
jgi:hypothetical protein